ncbi:MAG: molybdopterin molybdotransferase MoeA [Microthrixaceae bacterium]|nr:molybdopterin molybdotransferase MoeA [Microthrixaceae bacterium]
MPLVPYSEALDRVLARIEGLGRPDPVECPISEAVGMVTALPVVAPEAVPPFDNTAVDGFAVRSADTAVVPVELSVVATVAAGEAPSVVVGPGECVRIMTGAVMPHGADAVVMVEHTEPAGESASGVERVRILASSAQGRHVRPTGDDLHAGAVALAAGTVIRPAHVGLLATVGRSTVTVHPRPRVGVMSTGDELVGPGVDLQPGQIRDSNRQMLLALCEQAGFRLHRPWPDP